MVWEDCPGGWVSAREAQNAKKGGPGVAGIEGSRIPSSAPISQEGCPYTQVAFVLCTPCPGVLNAAGYKPAPSPQGRPQELAGEGLPRGSPPPLPPILR